MKKIMMTLAAIAVAATMNAQGYVGGSLGFTSDKKHDGKVTTTGFAIAPEIGYNLDDKMAVGVALGFGYSKEKDERVDPSTEVSKTTFNIKPYLRYQAFEVGKVNVFVDGGLNFALASQKDYKPAMDFGLFVTPGIAYNVTDKWSIVAKLNDMFYFGYHKDAIADVAGAPEAPSSINAGLSTGGFQLGSLTFGVYYNF